MAAMQDAQQRLLATDPWVVVKSPREVSSHPLAAGLAGGAYETVRSGRGSSNPKSGRGSSNPGKGGRGCGICSRATTGRRPGPSHYCESGCGDHTQL